MSRGGKSNVKGLKGNKKNFEKDQLKKPKIAAFPSTTTNHLSKHSQVLMNV